MVFRDLRPREAELESGARERVPRLFGVKGLWLQNGYQSHVSVWPRLRFAVVQVDGPSGLKACRRLVIWTARSFAGGTEDLRVQRKAGGARGSSEPRRANRTGSRNSRSNGLQAPISMDDREDKAFRGGIDWVAGEIEVWVKSTGSELTRSLGTRDAKSLDA
jgi:hypothetical protein